MSLDFLVRGVKFDGEPPPPSMSREFAAGAALPRRAFAPIGGRQFQADAGSCTAHGFSAAVESWALKAADADLELCRQDIYLQSRLAERNGAEGRDGGAYPSKVRDALRLRGTVTEARKPYVAHDVTTWRRPSAWDADALLLACRFDAIPTTTDAILPVLAERGCVVICHAVYSTLFNLPVSGREGGVVGPVLGGHCRVAVGYDLDEDAVLVMNSWRGWGIAHPVDAAQTDSFSWVPFAALNDPRWLQDASVLAVPPVGVTP